MEKQQIILEDTISKLKDNALLAMILSSDRINYCTLEQSTNIIRLCDNSLNMLYEKPVFELQQRCGMTANESYRLKAAFELADRRKIKSVLEKPKISRSEDIFQLFRHLSDLPYEEFWIVTLNKGNRVLDQYKVSEGGVSGTVVDPKKVFHHALNILASSIILIHNHPSGVVTPSEADKKITEKIVDGGKLLEISVLDHIIVGDNQYSSFSDNGLL